MTKIRERGIYLPLLTEIINNYLLSHLLQEPKEDF
jgi:hypothetical protein